MGIPSTFHPRIRTALAAAAAISLLAVSALTPVPASAQLVFDRGNDIWAANDDGSNPHPLVQAAPLGMDAGLGSPAVAPNGSTLLFRGTTLRNAVAGHSQNFYGENSDGTYELADGVVRRLSAPPVPTGLSWTTGDEMPEPGPGGSYVYEHGECTEIQVASGFGSFWSPFCVSRLRTSSIASGAAGSVAFATPCDTDPEGGPADPGPDPASGSLRVVYAGCEVEVDTGLGPAAHGALMVGEPGGAPTPIALGPEFANVVGSAGFADPSFSPDGSHVVAYGYGGTTIGAPDDAAGIYVYPASPGVGHLVRPLRPSAKGLSCWHRRASPDPARSSSSPAAASGASP